MKRRCHRDKYFVIALIGFMGIFVCRAETKADPSKYPQFAQQTPAGNVPLSFISVDQLVEEIKGGKKPLILDVRSEEEYREVHILGSSSAPLQNFKSYVESIPKDRLVILY
jgi:hypothetical protein